MTKEQEDWLVAEVMDSMKMSETEERSARRYVKRAVDKILIYCNREDLPEQLLSTAAQIAEDMLKADLVKTGEKEVASINRGDTAISYRDGSGNQKATVDFMKDYEKSLNRFKNKSAEGFSKMTEADILATTYEDTVTVYRAFKDTLPGGESVFKSGLDGKVVYEDVECALSTHTGGKLQQSKSTAKTETTFCLFTRPEVDIQTNDFLVITHFGKKIEAVAGFPECMKSHNNIPVKLDKETV